jgi:hypothetical protein
VEGNHDLIREHEMRLTALEHRLDKADERRRALWLVLIPTVVAAMVSIGNQIIDRI